MGGGWGDFQENRIYSIVFLFFFYIYIRESYGCILKQQRVNVVGFYFGIMYKGWY